MNNDTRPLMLSIWCITYNHEPYIRQCLDGFVMQNTNFRFEAIVHDDASTDGTAAIVREYAEKYPDIIKPILETDNQYSKGDGSLDRIMGAACKGKYIAFCEGDDYWVDPLKLQKQVDFLESHPEYGMVFTDYQISYVDSGQIVQKKCYIPIANDDNLKWKILTQKHFLISTATILGRNSLHKQMYENIEDFNGFPMGDTQLLFHFSRMSKIHCINNVTAVYRKHQSGATGDGSIAKSLSFSNSVIKMKMHMAKRYQAPKWVYSEIAEIDGILNLSLLVCTKNYNEAENRSRELFDQKRFFCMVKLFRLLRINNLKIVYHSFKFLY